MRLPVVLLSVLIYCGVLTSYAHQTATRVITLAPSLTDMMIELNATDKLVGVLDGGKRPEAVKDIPSVGRLGSVSLEKLISLKPDLILVLPTSLPASQKKRLTDMGFPILEVKSHDFNDLAENFVLIGSRVDKEERGMLLAHKIQSEMAILKMTYQQVEPKRVFYQIWNKPLYTIGKDQIISQALKLCGANNIFSDLTIPAPIVNAETVVQRNPEVIVASHAQQLTMWESWKSIDAVKNKKLLVFNNSHLIRPSYAMLEATKQLCQLIHSPNE